MVRDRIIEYLFYFGLLAGVGYIVWQIVAPFAGTLAFAAIVATICYPLYERVRAYTPKKNASAAALFTTFLVVIIVVIPFVLIGSLLLREALSVYTLFNTDAAVSVEQIIGSVEGAARQFIPGFSIDIETYVQQIAHLVATNLGSIFTGTAATLLLSFIALISVFYFFRDGRRFTTALVRISPLPDNEDKVIVTRLARAVRSVTVGIVLVAIIQGVLTAVGLALFGFDRAVLWGSIAAFGALIPGLGTSIVFVPAIIYLVLAESYWVAAGVALWAAFAVGLIDNLLGPYLISRGNAMHPFVILISVLGGVVLFGPIGFILGPVMVSLLIVLFELYDAHVAKTETCAAANTPSDTTQR